MVCSLPITRSISPRPQDPILLPILWALRYALKSGLQCSNSRPAHIHLQMAQDDPVSLEFLKDETVKAKLENAKKLSDVKASDYDAVFYVGGHGPLFDLAVDPVNIKLATDVSDRWGR
jgi:hypothetical protein